MRSGGLWYVPLRLASRTVQRMERRGLAWKEKTMSKHNTLLEGAAKKGGPAAKYAQKIASAGENPSRGAEAAYFFSDDNYKVRKMAGLDTSVEAIYKPYEPDPVEDPVAARKEKWRAMIDEEFAEFDGDKYPVALKNKVAGVKERALNLLEKTTMEAKDGHKVDKEMESELFEVDRKMVRTVKRIELGIPDASEADKEDLVVQKWGPRMQNADIATFGVLLFTASFSYVTFKIVSDPKHAAVARQDLSWLVLALEAAGALPAASSADT